MFENDRVYFLTNFKQLKSSTYQRKGHWHQASTCKLSNLRKKFVKFYSAFEKMEHSMQHNLNSDLIIQLLHGTSPNLKLFS